MNIKVDMKQVDGIRRWYGDQPKRIRQACGHMLNEIAFGVRLRAISVIGREMTVRNPKFVAGRIQVKKANIYVPVSRQQSITGSVAIQKSRTRGLFTGWTEQEHGDAVQRNRLSTLASRSGDIKKQMRPSVRLKPGKSVVDIMSSEYDQKGGGKRPGVFFAMAIRKKETRILKVGKRFFKRKNKKIEMVQFTKRKQPRRLRWLILARREYFKRTNIQDLWRRVVSYVMTKPSKI